MIIPVGFAQVNFLFAGADFPTGAEVTLGVQNASAAGTLEDQANLIANHFAVTLSGAWGQEQDNTTVMMKEGPNATGNQVAVPGGGTGTLTDSGDYPAVAVLVRKNTNFGGRTGRGRMYWPMASAGAVDDGGQLTTLYVDLIDDAFAAFMAALVGSDLPPVLLHGDPGVLPMFITSFSCQTTLATQRRRQRR